MVSRLMKLPFSEHGRNCVKNGSMVCGAMAMPVAPAATAAAHPCSSATICVFNTFQKRHMNRGTLVRVSAKN
jgi:hypothetical protein